MRVALMPLRSGSKGVPDKNIREFRGKPLFYWNLKAILDSDMFDGVWVSTDSTDYIELVEKYFSNVLFALRTPRLSYDESPTIRLAQWMIEWVDMKDDDYFALTQATSPYLTVKDIQVAFAISDLRDSIMTAGRMKRFLWTEDGEGLNVPKDAHQRRQDWKGTLVQNGCFYLTTAGMIRDTGMLWGGKVGFIEQPHWFDIDEEADFVYGEEVMKNE